MADFGSTINAYLAGRKVNMRPLVLFDFRDGEEALWGGEYDLTVGGRTWRGLSNIASVDGLDQAATYESSAMTFTLSGVEKPGADLSFLAIAVSSDRENYVRRLATVYMQFFDDDWQALDEPFALKAGFMGQASVSRVRAGDGYVRTISMPAYNIFLGRGVAPYSTYTDRDQQKRFPGDKGMQFIPSLQQTQIPVPWR